MNNKDALDYWEGKQEASQWALNKQRVRRALELVREHSNDASVQVLVEALDLVFYELELHLEALKDLAGEEE